MTTSVELELAQHFVDEYVDESEHWQADHHDALECRDCEDWLQKGINTFRWVRRAEEALAEADRLGLREMTDREHHVLDVLYRAWLRPCESTEQWVADLNRRGYIPENLAQFRETCEQVRSILEEREWYSLSRAAFDAASAE